MCWFAHRARKWDHRWEGPTQSWYQCEQEPCWEPVPASADSLHTVFLLAVNWIQKYSRHFPLQPDPPLLSRTSCLLLAAAWTRHGAFRTQNAFPSQPLILFSCIQWILRAIYCLVWADSDGFCRIWGEACFRMKPSEFSLDWTQAVNTRLATAGGMSTYCRQSDGKWTVGRTSCNQTLCFGRRIPVKFGIHSEFLIVILTDGRIFQEAEHRWSVPLLIRYLCFHIIQLKWSASERGFIWRVISADGCVLVLCWSPHWRESGLLFTPSSG